MAASIPGMSKPSPPADPFKWMKKAWKWSAVIRKPLGLVFIVYGWQQLWRNGQADEAPFFVFALAEWWDTGRDAVAAVWNFFAGGNG